MSDSFIALAIQGNIATLSINRPECKNALTQTMWQRLYTLLCEIEQNPDVRAVILTGRGGCFSAGADIKEFTAFASNTDALKDSNTLIMQTQLKLERLNRPTIAMVEGVCIGGGLGLALACDIRIAADNAGFAITPAKLGLLYSHRDTRRLLALVGPARTKELLFSGQMITAQQAANWGLINQQTSTASLAVVTNKLADKIAANSQSAIRGIKTIIAGLEGTETLTEDDYATLFEAAFSSEDCKEGLAAFMEKRPAKFGRS